MNEPAAIAPDAARSPRWPAEEAGPRPKTVLVPTERHVEVVLALREKMPPPRARVRTLRSFVRDALATLAPHLRVAPPEVTMLATRRVLDAMARHPVRYPDEPASRVAFAIAVDRAVGSLRRAGTSAASLREVGLPAARLVADALEGVDALLARASLVDARGAGSLVARWLRDPALDPRVAAEIAGSGASVSGILAWDASDLDCIEAIHALASGGTSVALPRIEDAEKSPIGPVGEQLEGRWGSLDHPPDIAWIEPPKAARAPAATTIVEARSIEAEARAVAAEVLAAIARGSPPERVAIVVPELEEERLEPLRSALAAANVPYSEPRGRPATANPEARAALTLLAMAEGPITRDHLIDLLRAPGAHTGWWMEKAGEGDAAVRATELAHRLRDVPVVADATGALFVKELRELIATRSREMGRDDGREAWMPRALTRLLESISALAAARSRRTLAKALHDLFDKLELGKPSARELSAALQEELGGGSALALGAMGEGATAVRAVREALTAITDAAGLVAWADAPCTPAELAIELEASVRSRVTSAPSARAGSVRIARAAELCALPHDLVVVTGLDGAAYGAGATGSLLDERITAALPAVVRPASAREREATRGAELAWVLSLADRVVMTRSPAHDGEEAGEAHPLSKEAQRRGAAVREEPSSRVRPTASPLDARSARLIAVAAGAEPPPRVAACAAVERARAAFFLDPRAAAGPYTGRVELARDADGPGLRAGFGGASAAQALAVTAVERAAACAFAGFAGRLLRVRRGEDTGEAASPRDRGNLVHRAIEGAFLAARELGANADARRMMVAAREGAERAVGADPASPMAPLRREAMAQAVNDALGAVAHAIARDDGVRFAMAEKAFGPREEAPWGALELPAALDEEPGGEAGSVFVKGTIDRVDRTTDGRRARVVDYKTGKLPDLGELGKSLFQLPIYAEVVARCLGSADIEAVYVRVRSGGLVEERPAEKDADRRVSHAIDRVAAMRAFRRVVLRQWRGDVAPRPISAAVCGSCDARDVCRRPAVMPLEEDAEAE